MTTRTPAPVPVDTGATAPVALDRAAAPVPVPVDTTPALRPPPERAPAPVNTLVDPELPAPPVPVVRPSATQAAPAPDPYPQEPVAVVIPVEEQPVPETPVVEPDPNITPDTSRYITVSEDGAVVLINASTLNFTGTGVTVTANNSTATIDITAGGSGYGNANVTTLLSAFGSNTVTTTGNITAGYFIGNGSLLTGLAGNYGNANVVSLLAALGSNSIVTTGNITAGNFSVTGNSVTWSNASITQTSAADIAITGDGQVTVRSLDGTYQWTFGSSGNFTAPGNVTANYFIGNGSQLTNLPTGGIVFEYDIANFTVANIPAAGTMQFTNRDGEVVVPDQGTRLWINATDGTAINTGSTWLAMAENSERGTLTLQQDGAQTPYRVSNIGVYNTPEVYRGYRAGVNQIWGDDPSINQIIITNAADPVFYNENFDLEDDVFHATNLADATAVYMVNVYGSDDFTALSQTDLWNFFTSFVDNVIYQNTDTETQDVAQIRTAFNNNFNNFYGSINSTKYDPEFRFASGTTYYSSAPATGGSGEEASLRVRLNANYTYTVMGIAAPGFDYAADDTIIIPGDELNGATPANDLVVTVNTVDGNGGITAVTLVSGVAAFPWRTNSISDGGDDQYDGGNYINTNLAQEILYQGGNVTAGTTQFGTDSEYVVMYNSSIFCMAATGVDITDLYYSGDLGADGDGFLRWSGLRSPNSATSVEYAYMRCELGTGNLEPQVGQTYQVGLDSGGINLDGFYSFYNDAVNWWYFGADRDWRLESQQQLEVQSYNTLTLRTLVPNEPTGLGSPEINIRTDDGSDGNASVNLQAGSGGPITIQAGDAGSNNGVPTLGNNGGGISILAGDATGNNQVGGGITIAAGGGANGTAGNVTIRTRDGTVANGVVVIETNNLDNQKFWTFDATGNITVPANGNINGADGDFVRIQSVEEGVVRSGMILNPGDGLTRLESWDNENSQGFTTADWATGEYIDAGGTGQIAFTDAPNIINLVNSIEVSRLMLQVNGGAFMPSDGFGSGGNNITFNVPTPPASSPEAVTSFTMAWADRSRIEMDYDEGELNIEARGIDINITGDQDIDIQSTDIIRIENSSNVNGITITTDAANAFLTWTFGVDGRLTFPGTPRIDTDSNNFEVQAAESVNFEANAVVNIYTDTSGSAYQWQFGDDGNLTLPSEGNIVGITANNSGSLQWVGNSSGDGNGYTTLRLIPDDTVTGSDQYLIIDPTAPGHIHIRAGGTQDNSGADLILGGENSSFRVNAGSNAAVQVTANSHIWSFEPGGYATVPVTDVANLVPANTVGVGARSFVTDADTQTFANTAVGGGANAVPVYSDGTVWRVG